LRLAKVDVPYVHKMPILVIASIVANVPVRLVGDVALFPPGHLRFHRFHVSARPKLQEHPSRLAAPTCQELRAVCIQCLEIEPKQSLETRRYEVEDRQSCLSRDGQDCPSSTLALSTTYTFRPPNDARDLGIRLNRIIWLSANRSAGGAATSSPR